LLRNTSERSFTFCNNLNVLEKEKFCFVKEIQMPKIKVPKINRCVCKKDDDGKQFFQIKFKNLDRQQVKDLRTDINSYLECYFKEDEPVVDEV